MFVTFKHCFLRASPTLPLRSSVFSGTLLMGLKDASRWARAESPQEGGEVWGLLPAQGAQRQRTEAHLHLPELCSPCGHPTPRLTRGLWSPKWACLGLATRALHPWMLPGAWQGCAWAWTPAMLLKVKPPRHLFCEGTTNPRGCPLVTSGQREVALGVAWSSGGSERLQ